MQVVIVPCGINVNVSEEEKNNLMVACQEYEKILNGAGIRVKGTVKSRNIVTSAFSHVVMQHIKNQLTWIFAGDYRDNYSPGWKFNHWELKGVPLRLEIGPRDVKQGEYVAVRRDTSQKQTQSITSAAEDIKQLLQTIQKALLDKYAFFSWTFKKKLKLWLLFRATQELENHTVVVENFGDFISQLDKKNIILSPFCGDGSCEEKIKKESTRFVLFIWFIVKKN